MAALGVLGNGILVENLTDKRKFSARSCHEEILYFSRLLR